MSCCRQLMSVLVGSEAIEGCPLVAQLAGTLCTVPFAPTLFFPSFLPSYPFH